MRRPNEAPGYGLSYFWKRVPQTLEELSTNARLTAESFRGRAQGGLLADQIVPDWAVLMVQFQNLDPFQHRVWPYLNVDEAGIDSPDWNAAAAGVIRGLDDAIGTLCELADRRGAAVMVVSDHGFGPCKGRIHVNRILVNAGVARLPGWSGRIGRRTVQAYDHLRLWFQKRDDPAARSASFDQSIAAQYPFDWKRHPGLRAAPRHGGDGLCQLRGATRHHQELRSHADTSSNRRRPLGGQPGAAEAHDPETGVRLFTKFVAIAETFQIDPTREGYPDLIAVPDDPYWVRTKLSRGRLWVEADPNLPGTHRPEGVIALAGAGLAAGRYLNAELVDVTPTILNLLHVPIPAHIEGKSIVRGLISGDSEPRVSQTRQDRALRALDGPHRSSFEILDRGPSHHRGTAGAAWIPRIIRVK